MSTPEKAYIFHHKSISAKLAQWHVMTRPEDKAALETELDEVLFCFEQQRLDHLADVSDQVLRTIRAVCVAVGQDDWPDLYQEVSEELHMRETMGDELESLFHDQGENESDNDVMKGGLGVVEEDQNGQSREFGAEEMEDDTAEEKRTTKKCRAWKPSLENVPEDKEVGFSSSAGYSTPAPAQPFMDLGMILEEEEEEE